MEDIHYFLDAERSYSEPKLGPLEDIGEFGYPYDPLSFLSKKQFELCRTPFENNNYEKYGLTDVEIIIFQVFIGCLSGVFRGDRYKEGMHELIKEMRAILESVIQKAPIFEGGKLYRFCKDDPINFCVDQIYEPPHSLTTTKDNWEQDTNVYIITTLKDTAARSLYKLYNHGKECQVNFPSGTKFKITDIRKKGEYKEICMTELS